MRRCRALPGTILGVLRWKTLQPLVIMHVLDLLTDSGLKTEGAGTGSMKCHPSLNTARQCRVSFAKVSVSCPTQTEKPALLVLLGLMKF